MPIAAGKNMLAVTLLGISLLGSPVVAAKTDEPLTSQHYVFRLDLPNYIIVLMTDAGIRTIANLETHSKLSLMGKPGIGRTIADRIEDALKKEGFALLQGEAAFRAEVRDIPQTMKLHHYLSLDLVIKLREVGIMNMEDIKGINDLTWIAAHVPGITRSDMEEIRVLTERAGLGFFKDYLDRLILQKTKYDGSYTFDTNVQMSKSLRRKLEKAQVQTFDDAFTTTKMRKLRGSLKGDEITEWDNITDRLLKYRMANPKACAEAIRK